MMDPVVRKLPLSTTVLAVKQLAAKLFKWSVELQRVCFTSSPSRSVMRAAAAALHQYHTLISPLAHPV
jgi:hypothetical protein